MATPREVVAYLESERLLLRRRVVLTVGAACLCVGLGFVQPVALGILPALFYVGGLHAAYRWSTYREVQAVAAWERGALVVETSGAWIGAQASGEVRIGNDRWSLSKVRSSAGAVPAKPAHRMVVVAVSSRTAIPTNVVIDDARRAWRINVVKPTKQAKSTST